MKESFFAEQHVRSKACSRPRAEVFTACLQQDHADRAWRHAREQRAVWSGEKILLVQKHTFLRLLMRGALQFGGYAVLDGFNGEHALLKVHCHDGIDLLLLDMDVPDRKDREMYGWIRRLHPDIRVLLTSSYPEELMQDRGLVDAHTRVLAKPFGAPLLLRKVREVLDESRASHSPAPLPLRGKRS